jgi:hypothetical protein
VLFIILRKHEEGEGIIKKTRAHHHAIADDKLDFGHALDFKLHVV